MSSDLVPNEPTSNHDNERLRLASKHIAEKIDSIIEKLGGSAPPEEKSSFPLERYHVEKHSDGYISIETKTDILGGYGYDHTYLPPELRKDSEERRETRRIYLYRSAEEDTKGSQLYKPLQVDTRCELYVGVHTDTLTMPQVENMLAKDSQKAYFLGSYYYFDRHGNYGKGIMLPSEIKDERPVLRTLSSGLRYIKCELEPGEFELVEFALGILEEGANAN